MYTTRFVILICTCECFPVGMYVHYEHVWCPQRSKGTDSLELELRVFVNHYVDLGNKI